MRIVGATEAARLIIAGAALSEPRAPSGPAAAAELVRRLGYVQVDSILAVERAHDTIMRTRLSGYAPAHLRAAVERRRALFEHWTHDASLVPAEWLPWWSRRFARFEERMHRKAWWRDRTGGDPKRAMRTVLARVRRQGPSRARDLGAAGHEPGGWWQWTPEKAALECLWRSGKLAVSHREGFEKVYDLFDRVHPPSGRATRVTAAAHLHWACSEALQRLRVATPREVAAFFADVSAADVTRWARSVRGRELAEEVRRERADRAGTERALAWRQALAEPDGFDARTVGTRLLSPFDPLVRDRARLERLWGFRYRFEAFVPGHLRVDGYYTLPVLQGDRFIGRCALRSDRERGTLVLERWRSEGADRPLPRPVRTSLEQYAAELGLERIETPSAAGGVRRPASVRRGSKS